jgi:hypothetical protein
MSFSDGLRISASNSEQQHNGMNREDNRGDLMEDELQERAQDNEALPPREKHWNK